MRAIHLQQNEHVGTTYKRALTRFHRARDHKVARDFSCLNGDETRHSWFVRLPQTEGQTMRKPRDFDSELQALTDQATALKPDQTRTRQNSSHKCTTRFPSPA